MPSFILIFAIVVIDDADNGDGSSSSDDCIDMQVALLQ
jgi:hypothetical protein